MKCLCCREIFLADARNRHHQKFCQKEPCRQASKRASQRRWLAKPQNADHFGRPDQVERVRQWRQSHPGYWRTHKRKSAGTLQDIAALLFPPSLGVNEEDSPGLEELGLQPAGLLEALKRHIEVSRRSLRVDRSGGWEGTIKDIEDTLSMRSSSMGKRADGKIASTGVGGGLNFSREATPKEICLRADEYAVALEQVLVASQKHGELCLALFGHWGRGKSFLMRLTADRLGPKCAKFERNQGQSWLAALVHRVHFLRAGAWRVLRNYFSRGGGYRTICTIAWSGYVGNLGRQC